MALPRANRRSTAFILFLDAVAFGVYWYLIPGLNRPLDGLCIVAAVMGVITALAAKPSWIKSLALLAVAVGVMVFGLEMIEKKFRILEKMRPRATAPTARPEGGAGDKPSYTFNPGDAATWLEARDRLLKDGADPETLRMDIAADPFAGVPENELRVHTTRVDGLIKSEVTRGGGLYVMGGPVGVEMRPGLVWHTFAREEKTGATLWDSVATIDSMGNRNTKGDAAADAVYFFTGCSFTFGLYLNDHETLPWYFSEAGGFNDKVINAGVSGSGPHQSLRDLELNHRMGRAGVKPRQVKGVVYSYIGDHQVRVGRSTSPGAPRYVLAGGEPVYRGTLDDIGRLGLLLTRSRVFSLPYNLAVGIGKPDPELTAAIIGGIHRLCVERYGVPLLVVDWVEEKDFADRLRKMGVVVVPVTDAFGPEWRREEVKYFIADAHPTPYANRILAGHLRGMEKAPGE